MNMSFTDLCLCVHIKTINTANRTLLKTSVFHAFKLAHLHKQILRNNDFPQESQGILYSGV